MYEEIYEILQEIVKKYGNDGDLQDLRQDIILEILQMPVEKVEKMYDDGSIRYFLARLVKNNVCSTSSRYFYTYKKNKGERLPNE